MKIKITKATSSAPTAMPDVPAILVTLLIGIFAAGLVAAQFHYAQDPRSQLALANLDKRVPVLEQITNLVERDQFCIPLAAYGRALDHALPKNARVFLTGMLGATNQPSTGYYYFLRNYLFPRAVDISLDGKATFGEGGFSGIPCDSPTILQTNGFDLMIQYADNRMQLIPLTTNGVPKSE